VDVDYKALSNAGTWMVGRLQTDQDKQRLLDGLESATGGIKRAEFDRLISGLGKRIFLYHNVHEKQPEVFQTRWAMSYLAGPLTLTQVPQLNELAGVLPRTEKRRSSGRASATATTREAGSASAEKPAVSGISEYFIASNERSRGGVFTPALLAVAEIRYLKQNPPVDYKRVLCTVVENPRETGQIWEDCITEDVDPKMLQNKAPGGAKFGSIPDFMTNSRWWSGQEREFEQWIFETDTVSLRSSSALGVSVGPEVSDAEFSRLCRSAAETKAQAEIKKLETSLKSKKTTLEHRIETQELQVQRYRQQMTTRGMDTALKIGESLFKLATKGRLTGVSSSSSKVRMTADARTRLKEAETVLENYQEDLKTLQDNFESEKQSLLDKWLSEAENISEVKMTPTKQNIRITHFGIGWKA
jgi:hypothetical protein